MQPVLPSLTRTHRAFGLAVLEAMQHGKPCIVSDLHGSGLPWIVRQSGNGLLAEVDKPESWRTAITQLQHDPERRAQLGQTGQAAAAKLFSIETSARSIVHLYAGVVPEVFFEAPKRNRLRLILAQSGESAAVAESTLSKLKKAGCRSFLLLGSTNTRVTLDALAARHDDVTVLIPALHLSELEHHPGRHPLCAAAWLPERAHSVRRCRQQCTGGARAAQADNATSPAADLRVGTYARTGHQRPNRDGPLDRWARHLTGVRLQGMESRLRLYQHDAMVIAASREATLLDHDDVSALLMMKKPAVRDRST
ncbi:MAG: glycosyltransferase family 4 protein [Burkholderiales bacterium]|nr:glycosyltransferase family 4 protein [Burkholderiales bacterium]